MAANNNGIGSIGFLTGANLPWINYGWDFGPCAWGRGYRPEAFDAAFRDLASRGANCVRLWVFGDGRASPSFDLSTPATRSLTTGLHPEFYADFEDMLNKAQKHGIKVMPVLWDFIAMNVPNKPGDKPTPQQGGHGALFSDPNLANAFMENALRPLIQRFGSHPAVAAWDIFNEPEWCVADAGADATTAQKVPLAAMRTFIGRAASIIHNEGGPGTLVTVGSASVKWSWERGETRPEWCSDFWGDAALVASNNGDPAAFLDFGQTHYYPWMKKEIDPFVNQPETYCGGRPKPLIIGEAQANLLKTYSAAALLRNAREKGYAGLLYWSYKVRFMIFEFCSAGSLAGLMVVFPSRKSLGGEKRVQTFDKKMKKKQNKKRKQEVDDKGGWDDFAKCVGGECEGAFAVPAGGAGVPSKAEKLINRVFGGFK